MFIERQGAQLFFEVRGAGPALVLLHPTPTNHQFWLPMVDRLSAKLRIVLVDLRGHGRSTLGSGPMTMDTLADDVHAVLTAAKVERAHFAGCSIGSYLLYRYWAKYPSQMQSMAFLCGKPQPDSAANREKRQEWMELAQRPGGLSKFYDSMAATLLGVTAQQRHPELRRTARAMMDDVSLDAMLAIQQCLGSRPDSVPVLTSIGVPVCVVAGGEDASSTPPEMRVIADCVPQAEFHLLPDAGHYAPLEQPGAVGDILEKFFLRADSVSPAQKGGA